MKNASNYDVVIAGGGIAGLSAALILGRCRRAVLLCDSASPRNKASAALHGFISRDGINPLELRELAYGELAKYPTVTCIRAEVVDAEAIDGGYAIRLEDGGFYSGRYLLVATGVIDNLPPIRGVDELYGRNVFHCPYWDGWEVRDLPLVALGEGTTGYEYALELTCWSSDVTLCTGGGPPPSPAEMDHLRRNGIMVCTEAILGLEPGPGDQVTLSFANGTLVARALFFNPDQYQASPLAEKLGCVVTGGGVVKTGSLQQTAPRLFVAGDAAKSVQFAIVAAAEGAEAAFAINSALHGELLRP